MIVIVDSDALIGTLNPKDLHFRNAGQILKKLVGYKTRLVYPATVITETVTFFQGRLNQPKLAAQIVDFVKNGELSIEAVDEEILKRACSMMDFKKSKHHTLFDCVVMAVADENKAEAIFSFDKFYEKNGYKLASDL